MDDALNYISVHLLFHSYHTSLQVTVGCTNFFDRISRNRQISVVFVTEDRCCIIMVVSINSKDIYFTFNVESTTSRLLLFNRAIHHVEESAADSGDSLTSCERISTDDSISSCTGLDADFA